MDPKNGTYIIPNNDPYNPFPHSLLSTREKSLQSDVCSSQTREVGYSGDTLDWPGLAGIV